VGIAAEVGEVSNVFGTDEVLGEGLGLSAYPVDVAAFDEDELVGFFQVGF